MAKIIQAPVVESNVSQTNLAHKVTDIEIGKMCKNGFVQLSRKSNNVLCKAARHQSQQNKHDLINAIIESHLCDHINFDTRIAFVSFQEIADEQKANRVTVAKNAKTFLLGEGWLFLGSHKSVGSAFLHIKSCDLKTIESLSNHYRITIESLLEKSTTYKVKLSNHYRIINESRSLSNKEIINKEKEKEKTTHSKSHSEDQKPKRRRRRRADNDPEMRVSTGISMASKTAKTGSEEEQLKLEAEPFRAYADDLIPSEQGVKDLLKYFVSKASSERELQTMLDKLSPCMREMKAAGYSPDLTVSMLVHFQTATIYPHWDKVANSLVFKPDLSSQTGEPVKPDEMDEMERSKRELFESLKNAS